MEKEFIPYEQALALKELGFDEPCLFAFDNCSTPMRCSNLRTNEQKFNGVNYNSSTYTSQPTFSQAFRWFREKYKLHSTITSISQESWQWHITKPGESLGKLYEEDFYNYEEAELACLKKLIEIVKKQN